MHTHSLLLFHALLIASAAAAEPWAQFRGSDGQGIASQSKPPLEWSDTKNVRWKVELPGPGTLSPIQHGQRVFVTCYSGYGLDLNSPGELRALKRHLICLDAASGKVLWDRSVTADAAEDRKGGRGGKGGPIMAAMGEDLDTCIGTLVQKLDALGIAQNTFIIYMADNGMGGNLLKGGKSLCDEGGLRVPLIVAGPGIRGGVHASVPVVNFDIFPTVLDIAAPGLRCRKASKAAVGSPSSLRPLRQCSAPSSAWSGITMSRSSIRKRRCARAISS